MACHLSIERVLQLGRLRLPTNARCRSLFRYSGSKNPVTEKSRERKVEPLPFPPRALPSRFRQGCISAFWISTAASAVASASIGLAISGLRTSITISAASHMRVTGPESERVRGYLQTMQRALDIDSACRCDDQRGRSRSCRSRFGHPARARRRSGVRRFHGLPLDVRGDAIRLGRGARSGVGIGLFDRGGLVVDGGRGPLTTAAPIVSRMPFPGALAHPGRA